MTDKQNSAYKLPYGIVNLNAVVMELVDMLVLEISEVTLV